MLKRERPGGDWEGIKGGKGRRSEKEKEKRKREVEERKQEKERFRPDYYIHIIVNSLTRPSLQSGI
jgi:hypothetical protein